MSRLTLRPTLEEVQAYRAKQECGIHEALAVLHKKWRRENLFALSQYNVQATTVGDCRAIIGALIQLLAEDLS